MQHRVLITQRKGPGGVRLAQRLFPLAERALRASLEQHCTTSSSDWPARLGLHRAFASRVRVCR